MSLFEPIGKALSQTDDPVFIGVLWRSLVWSALCFVGLHVLTLWGVHQLHLPSWIGWLADIAGTLAASILAMWLFLPVAAAIGTIYIERISRAVEARFYPHLPPPAGESAMVQMWDGGVVALKVLALNILALVLVLALPGIGFVLGWAIAAYAIGRGLFVAVAMRRMPRPVAESVYYRIRLSVLAQGAVLALAAYVPVLNLLIPVIGTAAMVHLLDRSMAGTVPPAAFAAHSGA
jgi:CysZ protein